MDIKSTSVDSQSIDSRSGFAGRRDLSDTSLYYHLIHEAERVRWKISDIPWSLIEKDKVSPALTGLIREAAFAELSTWSATHRFFQSFAEDVDFTQWITVWLYEETKHPQVLMRWLKHFGESFDVEFVMEGRKTQPFIKSRMATLVMNVLSEIEASTLYLNFLKVTEEPVLSLILRNLAADEARHASSFYSYAQRMLNASDSPDIESLEALKVLYFWLMNYKQVQHPVALFTQRVSGKSGFDELRPKLGFEAEPMFAKMRLMIGKLVGIPLESKEDVRRQFMDLQARLYAL